MNQMLRWKSDLILLLVAAVWGSGFVAQRLAAASLSTFYFNGGRFLLAAALLLPLAHFQRAGQPGVERKQIPWMMLAGALLFAASGLQQAGLATTSIGNASFITGLYVVIVPIILFFALRQRVSALSWFAVFLAAAGVALLSLQGEFSIAPGDVLELLGAVMWALHIILLGRIAGQGANVLWFSVIQFATCGALNLVLALVLDPQGINTLAPAWGTIAYSAVFPIGVGFTLQIAGQKHAPPLDAAIILSMEAVFGTLFGYLFLQEVLSPRQLIGCALLLAAMILAQIRVGPSLPDLSVNSPSPKA